VEAGYANSSYNFWIGMFAPAKTPPAILERLHEEARKALDTPAVTHRLAKLGIDPMTMTASAFDKLVREEVAVNTQVAERAGIRAN
jgi:tripartite-type tricarboxylate transporter receptor subunit TctC